MATERTPNSKAAVGAEAEDQLLTKASISAILLRIPVKYRRAVLFGLELNMPITRVMGLTWRQVRCLPITAEARSLIDRLPRHIRLSYVFWAPFMNGAAAPLFGIEEAVREASGGVGYEALRLSYRNLVGRTPDLLNSILRDSGLYVTSPA